MIEADHYNKERMLQIVETITTRWQQLMFRAEERLKLVMASMNWFKTAEQVSVIFLLCVIRDIFLYHILSVDF